MGFLSSAVGAVGSVAGSLLGAHSAKDSANRANKLTMDLAKTVSSTVCRIYGKLALTPFWPLLVPVALVPSVRQVFRPPSLPIFQEWLILRSAYLTP